MQLSLLPVAFPEVGLSRDSGGHAVGLTRSHCGTCRVTPQDQRGHSVGLRRSHDGTGMVIPRASCSSQKALAWRFDGHVAVRQLDAPPRLCRYELEVAAGG